MDVARHETTPPSGAPLAEGTARALLRYVDRAALDQLLVAFVEAVELPATVLSPLGDTLAGRLIRCPVCAIAEAPIPHREPGGASLVSGWARCRHGLATVVFPISARTGEKLAIVSIGPVALSTTDRSTLRRALLACGVTDKSSRAHLEQFDRGTSARAEAAARLLAQTLETIVREAAIASENADLVATQRRANQELTVLYSVSRALGSGIELQTIMQRLVESVGELLRTDVALVGLIEGDDLVTVASHGLLTFEARNGRLRVGEGLAGRVAATGEPLTTQDMQEDPRQYLTAINSREDLHAFAGVPLTLQGVTVGVLAVYRRVAHVFPASELQLLAHIADQAAVAMERAQLYEHERRTIGELRTLHAQIEAQHRALERASTIHDQLTQMVLQDAGLDAIVDALARALETPVAVEDQFLHLLARGPREEPGDAAATPLEAHGWTPRSVLDDAEMRRFFNAVRESRRPVALPAHPTLGLDHPRIVAPVIVSGDHLGFLSVEERDRVLEDPDLLAVGHAATIIALEMMKQRTRAEVERRLRGELLEELVGGEFDDPDAVRRRASYLGYNLGSAHALLLLVANDGAEANATPQKPRHGDDRDPLVKAIEHLAGQRSSSHMVWSRMDGTFVAVPLCTGTLVEAREIAESLLRDVRRSLASRLLVGIGRICLAPEDYAMSATEARRVIALARSLRVDERVVAYEDMGVYRLLADLPRPSDALRFADELLAPLETYDRHHGGNLLETLEAFLAANGVLQRASGALSIHVNTLSYRLQRIRELTGVDLNDSDVRLGLHLAVKIRQAARLMVG